jgi:hypothetical protein
MYYKHLQYIQPRTYAFMSSRQLRFHNFTFELHTGRLSLYPSLAFDIS